MSTTINTTHPPSPQQLEAERLETVLPRLRLVERLALRLALRGLLRLERAERSGRAHDREHAIRAHALMLDNDRRTMAAERADFLVRPLR